MVATVAFGGTTGLFGLNTQLNRSGDSLWTLRFDGSIAVQGYSRKVTPSVPTRLVNMTCPSTVVVLSGGTSRLDCTFVAVDAFGNIVQHADLAAVRALALDTGRIQASSSGEVLPVEVVVGALSSSSSSFSADAFVLRITPKATGQVTFASDAALGLTFAPVTVAASTADLSKSAISCTQSIFAGDSVACSVVLRDAGGNLIGGAESASAFALSSTSPETPRIQFKSTGTFLATIPSISVSGAYVLRANFSGFPIDVAVANVTTIVSAADAVDPARSTITCPRERIAGTRAAVHGRAAGSVRQQAQPGEPRWLPARSRHPFGWHFGDVDVTHGVRCCGRGVCVQHDGARGGAGVVGEARRCDRRARVCEQREGRQRKHRPGRALGRGESAGRSDGRRRPSPIHFSDDRRGEEGVWTDLRQPATVGGQLRGAERVVGFHMLVSAVLEAVGRVRGWRVYDAARVPGEVSGGRRPGELVAEQFRGLSVLVLYGDNAHGDKDTHNTTTE